MKKIISLLTIVFILTSCENEVKEINSTGGEILMGNNKGSVYSFGKMDDANHALNFSKAFTVKDYSFFTEENFNDTIFFYPEKGLDRLEFDIQSAIELIKSMHEPYDSITREIYDVIPLVPSYNKDLTVVIFPFTETRYGKDGSIEKYRFTERHYISGGKVYGVRKWSQEE
jgi:hypothetical protein